MTSRERMRRALDFDTPDRLPREVWLLPATRLAHGAALDAFLERWPGDISQVKGGRCPARKAKGDPYQPGQSTDEWGCVFDNLLEGVHGEVRDPLVKDWSDLDKVEPPVEWLTVDTEAVNAFCRATDKFVFASGWARLWERLQFLRGSENALMDLADPDDEFFTLLDLIHDFYLKQYEVWARTEVDALVMMDDWGSQIALLCHPDTWRAWFKPRYAEYTRIAHEAGKKFFMHSDGFISDIYPDLIEIGVDAINSQLFCMDIEELGRRHRGQITFWGEIDRQQILPNGTEAETRAAVRRVAEALYRPEGGIIAQFSFAGDTKLENAEAVFDEWRKIGG
jgi:uroporphyrinogen decarboxylase